MDTNAILSKLEKAAPGRILESGRFGRADLFSVWVEGGAVHAVATVLKADPALRLDWLENLSIAEIGDSLVASWFLRSRETQVQLVIRSSAAPDSADAPVEIPSVREVWPTATLLEDDLAELFGILFKKMSGENLEIKHVLLPNETRFPMRKSYLVGKAAK